MPVQQTNFFKGALERIEAVPGLKSAGVDGGGANVFFQPQGYPPAAPGQELTAALRIITPDFLKAIGTHLVSGRSFSDHDNQNAAPVAIVSESVAHRYWPQSDPIDSHVKILARVYSGKNSEAAHEADKTPLVELLHQGPERLGYETPLWTCPRVADLIQRSFQVDYHPGHVWRILRQLNWSVQQPVGRALERNQARIDEWKHKRWPEIKKKLKKKAERSSS